MAESPATRSRRGPATAATVEAVHDDLDELWSEAGFVPEIDRMAFTLAVVEVAANVVAHTERAGDSPLELQVDIVAASHRLQAEIYEFGAAPADVDLDTTTAVDDMDESGRGIWLVQELVSTVVFERRGDTNVWELRREYHAGPPQAR